MVLIVFWTIKILALAGVVFSIYSVFQPHQMLQILIKSFEWKMKWFGLVGAIQPGKNATNLTRIWSIVIALLFAAINYIFGNVVFIGYALKQ